MIGIVTRSSIFYTVVVQLERMVVFLLFMIAILSLLSAAVEPLYNLLSGWLKFNPRKTPQENIIRTVAKCIVGTVVILFLFDYNLYVGVIVFMQKIINFFRR